MSSAAPAVRRSPWRVPGDWWRSRSQSERVGLYTRWSLYLISASEPFALTSAGVHLRAPGVAVLLTLVHTAACLVLCRAGIDAYLRRRATPYLEAACAAVLGVVLAGWTVATLDPIGVDAGDQASAVLSMVVAVFAYTSAAASTVLPVRQMTWAALIALTLIAAAAVGLGAPPGAVGSVGIAAFVLLFVSGTYRFSVWLLGVVQQLDDAQQARAALAVAEERLRFARDLHDVVGRHLSAIAVKSELTAELTRRGDPRAVEQALEVRGLAHDSLREVRDVVRGYREVDLDTELAGSCALLRAAGIRCRTLGNATGWPPAVRAALGWGVREGTTNVLRHSTAATCTIVLESASDGAAARLTVTNDGVRERPGRMSRGTGLTGLAERVGSVGGTVEAGPEPPDRFALRIVVPLEAG